MFVGCHVILLCFGQVHVVCSFGGSAVCFGKVRFALGLGLRVRAAWFISGDPELRDSSNAINKKTKQLQGQKGRAASS